MKKSIFLRLLIYIVLVILFRVTYIIVGYLLGFGSSSDHFKSELNLDIIFFFLNVLSFWIFIRFIARPPKGYLEFIIVSALTLVFYVLQFVYFYQNHFFK